MLEENKHTDTTGFYLDGAKEMGYFDNRKPHTFNLDEMNGLFYDLMIKKDESPVEILRPLWFFHEGEQNITLGKLREFYKEKAIALYEKDGFIKINS